MARIRDDLRALSGYHSPQVDVTVRLNTNEASFAPPPTFVSTLAERLGGVEWNRYPDRAASALRTRLAALHGVPSEWVLVANGSNEVLQSILLAFGGNGRRAVVFEPGYQMHAQIARNTATPVETIEREREMLIDIDSALSVLSAGEPGGGVRDLSEQSNRSFRAARHGPGAHRAGG